jgi:hypothetical protein
VPTIEGECPLLGHRPASASGATRPGERPTFLAHSRRPECLLQGSLLKLAVEQPRVGGPFTTLMGSASGQINEDGAFGAQPASWFRLASSLTPFGASVAPTTGNSVMRLDRTRARRRSPRSSQSRRPSADRRLADEPRVMAKVMCAVLIGEGREEVCCPALPR